jgi:polysaccharide biosynthesis transport protein
VLREVHETTAVRPQTTTASAWDAVWRRRWLLLTVVVLAGVSAYFLDSQRRNLFRTESSVQIIPGIANSGFVAPEATLEVTNRYIELASSRDVLQEAALAAGETADVMSRVASVAGTGSGTLRVTGASNDPRQAARRARALTDALVAAVADSQRQQQEARLLPIQQRLGELQAATDSAEPNSSEAATLASEIQGLQSASTDILAEPVDVARVLRYGPVPEAPVSPKPVRTAITAAFAALLLAALGSIVWGRIRDRYASVEEAAEDLGLPVIGEMPRGALGDTSTNEAARIIRTNLQLMFRRESLHVLVTSAEQGVGKSHLASAVAYTAGRDGAAVTLIDADLRRPVLHQRFKVEPEPGLLDLLNGRAALEDVRREVATGDATRGGRLTVIPTLSAGDAAPRLLAGPGLPSALEQLDSETQLVVLDGPPTLAIADATVLAQHSTIVVLVIDATRSSRRRVRLARDRLAATTNAPIGVVFNSRTQAAPYGYYSG